MGYNQALDLIVANRIFFEVTLGIVIGLIYAFVCVIMHNNT